MQKTLTTTLPALVWALALVALGAALLFALGDASAQQPPISASIVDDNDVNTNSLCGGFVWSDGRCDLRIRVTDHDATDSDVTIVASPIFSGAFDASVITPDDSALSSQALGPTPSTYTIPGNTRQIFRLRMTPVVTASGAQYYQGYVRVHHGAGTNGRKLAEYRLTLQAPTPTSVSSESITSTSFAVRWKMDERARQTIIFWRPRDDGAMEESVKVTMVQNEKWRLIRNLQPSTCYVARVQPLLDGKSLEPAEIEVATLADPDATDPPVDPCATAQTPPTPPACTTSGDYDVDDDGLIEVSCLQQLDAIRHDLDGDGVPDINPAPPNAPTDFTWDGKTKVEGPNPNRNSGRKTYTYARGDFSDAERQSQYAAAYPSPDAGMGCPTSGCKGYELSADLDFDENSNGMRDDTYNTGAGWRPIMGQTYVDPDYWQRRFFQGEHDVHAADFPFNKAKMFRAVFEGNGRTISNLYINRPTGYHIGLFGYVAVKGVVRNLGLISPVVEGYEYVGTVAGAIERAQVTGSYAQGVEVTGRWRVGGLIGSVWGGRVLESYATGTAGSGVNGTLEVGGLIGLVNARTCASFNVGCARQDVQVRHAFASVDVTSEGAWGAGGLVGYLLSVSHIQHAYATGTVTTIAKYNRYPVSWGSLVGYIHGPMQLSQTYATGPIQAHDGATTGGLVGRCLNPATGSSWLSYWDTDTTGQTHSACNRIPGDPSSPIFRDRLERSLRDTTVGGKTTSELQTPTSASGIYSTWGPITVDGVSIPVWDFGTDEQYPILAYCAPKPGIDLSWDATRTEHCPLREATQHGRTYSASP